MDTRAKESIMDVEIDPDNLLDKCEIVSISRGDLEAAVMRRLKLEGYRVTKIWPVMVRMTRPARTEFRGMSARVEKIV